MASQITKKAIIAAYRKMIKTIPLNKLTVGDIATEAGINRQTFYYHFHDIYDLCLYDGKETLHNALENENDYSNCMMKIYDLMVEEMPSILNLYHHTETYEIKRILNDTIIGITDKLVLEASSGFPLPKEEHDIAVRFTTFMTTEFIISWIDKGMKENRNKFSLFADLLEENMKNTIAFLHD